MREFKIYLILAVDLNYAIGNKNDLLYAFPKDWKRFVELTKGKTIVMGRKTWESLPSKLKNRKNCVITTNKEIKPLIKNDIEVEPDLVLNNIEDVIKLTETEDVWVIGGANIYEQMFKHVDVIELTQIQTYTDTEKYDTDVKWLNKYILDSDFIVTKSLNVTDIDKLSGKEYKIRFLTLKN